jgi:hypothetical protein
MDTNGSNHSDTARIHVAFTEGEHRRMQITRINVPKPATSRRMLRKLLRMSAALSAEL